MKKMLCVLLSMSMLSASSAVLADDVTGYTILSGNTAGDYEEWECDSLCEEELCNDCSGCDDCDDSEHVYAVGEYALADDYTVAEEYAISDDYVHDYSEEYSFADMSGYKLDESAEAFSDDVLAANSHKHTPQTTYKPVDNSKHYYQKTCTSCGKVISKGNQNHQPKNSKGNGFTQLNDKKHKVTYTCKLCGKQYTKELSHSFKTKVEKNGNDSTYHNVIKYCQYCGYRASATQAKHTLSGGTCKKCGYQNTSKVYKGTGVCASYLNRPLYDNNVYKNCKKCGSYSASLIEKKLMKANVPEAGGGRVNIYHDNVKCNVCGTKYCNRCYAERVK